MRLNLPKCPRCGSMAPPGMVVCSGCMEPLIGRLRGTRELDQAVLTAQANEMRFARPSGSSGSRPLGMIPFNERLSTVAGEWRRQVQISAGEIAQAVGVDPPVGVSSAAEFIADNSRWIQRHVQAPAFLEFLQGLYSQVERLVDAPPERSFVGVCGEALEDLSICQTRIYAIDGRDEATCMTCGFAHAVYGRRAILKHEARGIALPPTDLARAVDGLGIVEVTAKQISKWYERGKLTPVRFTADTKPRPMFLVGDVIDLVNALAMAKM